MACQLEFRCPQVDARSAVCMRLVSSDSRPRAPSPGLNTHTPVGVGFCDRLHRGGGCDNGPVFRCVYQWDLLSAVTVPSHCGLVVRAGRLVGVLSLSRSGRRRRRAQWTTSTTNGGSNPDPRAAGLGNSQVPTPTPISRYSTSTVVRSDLDGGSAPSTTMTVLRESGPNGFGRNVLL